MAAFEVRYFVNLFCISDEALSTSVTVALGILVLLLIAGTIKLYNLALKKQEAISSPNVACLWDKTYCTLSLIQIRVVQFNLVVVVLGQAQSFILLAVGPAFRVYLWPPFPSDFDIQSFNLFRSLPALVQTTTVYLQTILNSQILLLQHFEWIAMIYIILTQRNRPLERILNDFEREPMDEPVWRAVLAHKLNYRKCEFLLQRIFNCFLLFFNFFAIGLLAVGMDQEIQIMIKIFLIINAIFIAILSLSFISVYCLMLRYHRYEFKRTKYSMLVYFCLALAFYCFDWAVNNVA